MKVNAIAQLEFEPIYYDSAAQDFNHYTTRTPIRKTLWIKITFNANF